MAKVKTNGKPVSNKKREEVVQALGRQTFALNAMTVRQMALKAGLGELLDINKECRYPDVIGRQDYWDMYNRCDIAARVNDVYPEESWAVDPIVYETEELEDTEFEKEFNRLNKKHHFWRMLHLVDQLSGIGRFGVLLIGLDDGKKLNQPVPGVEDKLFPDEDEEELEEDQDEEERKPRIIFLRAFPEQNVRISEYERDVRNPRYGLPTLYDVTFSFPDDDAGANETSNRLVHWTRIIHVADNLKGSPIFGEPRMQNVFNRLLDLRKILGGSGEMFWKGGFPGYSFEANPEWLANNIDISKLDLEKEVEEYSNGLRRYLTLVGVEAKSLAPQVADPEKHVIQQILAIAVAKCVPLKILLGSEEAKMASVQDTRAWNKRLKKRQNHYLTPCLIREFVNRLIAYGVLPIPEKYQVVWEDLNTPSDEDKATVAGKYTDALSKYVSGGCDVIMPPEQFLHLVMGFTLQEVEMVMDALEKHMADVTKQVGSQGKSKKVVPGRQPPAPPPPVLPGAAGGRPRPGQGPVGAKKPGTSARPNRKTKTPTAAKGGLSAGR